MLHGEFTVNTVSWGQYHLR